jgi:hypothetical protein
MRRMGCVHRGRAHLALGGSWRGAYPAGLTGAALTLIGIAIIIGGGWRARGYRRKARTPPLRDDPLWFIRFFRTCDLPKSF